jgi:hypothetical protein
VLFRGAKEGQQITHRLFVRVGGLVQHLTLSLVFPSSTGGFRTIVFSSYWQAVGSCFVAAYRSTVAVFRFSSLDLLFDSCLTSMYFMYVVLYIQQELATRPTEF